MSPDWQQFLAANASAVFGLLGALGGGVLSFLASLLLKRREFNLQIRGKLLDRQIVAHENILKLATEMRAMVGSMPFRVERNDLISSWPERTDGRADG